MSRGTIILGKNIIVALFEAIILTIVKMWWLKCELSQLMIQIEGRLANAYFFNPCLLFLGLFSSLYLACLSSLVEYHYIYFAKEDKYQELGQRSD